MGFSNAGSTTKPSGYESSWVTISKDPNSGFVSPKTQYNNDQEAPLFINVSPLNSGSSYVGGRSSAGSGGSTRTTLVSGTTPITSLVPEYEPIIVPDPVYALGPKATNIDISEYSTIAEASSADPGAVFYRWGIEPTPGCSAYWEWAIDAPTATLGGFGVGTALTEIDSEPGKESNPGAMLYFESGEATVYVDGEATSYGSRAAPTRVGVGVEVLSATELLVQWWLDGALVNATPYTLTISGPIWIPVLCTLAAGVQFRLEDAI